MSTRYIKRLNKAQKIWDATGNKTDTEKVLEILSQYTKLSFWQRLFSRKHKHNAQKITTALEFFKNIPKDKQDLDSLLKELGKSFKVTNIKDTSTLAITLQVVLLNTKPSAQAKKVIADKFGAGINYQQARKLLKRYSASRFVRFWRGESKNKHTKVIREFLKAFDKENKGKEVTAHQLLFKLQVVLADKKIELSSSKALNQVVNDINNNVAKTYDATPPGPNQASTVVPTPTNTTAITPPTTASPSTSVSLTSPAPSTETSNLADQDDQAARPAAQAQIAREQEVAENERLLRDMLAQEAADLAAGQQEPPQPEMDPDLERAIAASLDPQQQVHQLSEEDQRAIVAAMQPVDGQDQDLPLDEEQELALGLAASEAQAAQEAQRDESEQRSLRVAIQDSEYEQSLAQDRAKEAQQQQEQLREIIAQGKIAVQQQLEPLIAETKKIDSTHQKTLYLEAHPFIQSIQTNLSQTEEQLLACYNRDNNYFIKQIEDIREIHRRVMQANAELEQEKTALRPDQVELELPSEVTLIKSLHQQGEFKLDALHLKFFSKAHAEKFIQDARSKGLDESVFLADFAHTIDGEMIYDTARLTLPREAAQDTGKNAKTILHALTGCYRELRLKDPKVVLQDRADENAFLCSLNELGDTCLQSVPGLRNVRIQDSLLRNGNGRVNQCILRFDTMQDTTAFRDMVIPNGRTGLMQTIKSTNPRVIHLEGMRQTSTLDILKIVSEFDYTPKSEESAELSGSLVNSH